MKTIRKDGLIFKINNDNIATVCPDSNANVSEATVPSEVNGVPVRFFSFNCTFYEGALRYIRLPESISELSLEGFKKGYHINIEIDERNPHFFSDGKAVYTKDRSELIFFSARGAKEYTVHPDCKKILKSAFSYARDLSRVILPKGLKTVGESAFDGCDMLELPKLPEGLTEIGQLAFSGCVIPETPVLPSTLEVIGSCVFGGSKTEFTVQLPHALREIGETAFPYSWELVLSEDNKNLISAGGLILSGDGRRVICTAKPIDAEVLTVPDNVTEIADGVFMNNQQIKKVILPKTLRTIGERAFLNMQALREINLENVKEIGDCAFQRCDSLESISLNCDKIGDCAFRSCRALKKISVKYGKIGTEAFAECLNLTEAEADCEIIGDKMFKICASLRKAVLKNTRIIGNQAFLAARCLKEIVFPNSLEIIEDNAFTYSGINVGMKLTIPKTVRHIGRFVAYGGAREIHIYDNIGTDIGKDYDISDEPYTLYVHSAETDGIKYAVPIVGTVYGSSENNVHEAITSMFTGGVNFDFRKFDSFFGRISDGKAAEKFNAGSLRLKYGYELDEETRRMYEEQLARLAPLAAEIYIDNNEIEKLFDPELHKYLTAEQLLPLIDKSARKNLTELTAFLMRLRNEKLTAI